MNTIYKVFAAPIAVLTASAAFAQQSYAPQPSYQGEYTQQAAYAPRAVFSQRELDSMLAPVALYPDALLSQLLMASTYPQDVAEAARWSLSNRHLKGENAVRAVENEPWDPSVKSLVAFPEILTMMADKLDWTQRLGEAFLAQEDSVMVTVQQLRRRADEAGNLRSSEQIAVQREGENYIVSSPSPEIVYVPYYDSRVVYGSWWWPDYQPVYWNAWPGYNYYGGVTFGWGLGVSLHRNFFYGGFDWRARHIRYAGHRPYYFHGDHYWRGWRDHRRDGRHYTHDRAPGSRPGYDRRDNNRPGYNQGQRPGYNQGERPQNGDRGRTRPNYDGNNASNTGRGNPGVRTAAPRFVNEATNPASTGVRNRVETTGQPQRGAPVQGGRVQPGAGVPEAASPARSVQRVPQSGAPVVGGSPVQSGVPVQRSARPVQAAPNAAYQRGSAPAPVQSQRPVPQVQQLSAPQVQQRAAPQPQQSAPAPDRSRQALQPAGNAGGGGGGGGGKYRER